MSLAQMIRRVAGGQRSRMSDEDKPDMEEDDKDPSAADEQPVDGDDVDEDETAAAGDQPEDEEQAEDDASDKDMSSDEKKAFAKGRSAERSRIGKILGSSKADANPALAAHLAFKTSDSAKKALATLEHGGAAAASSGLSSRMNARGSSRTGRGGDTQVRNQDAGSSMIAALGRAGKLKGN